MNLNIIRPQDFNKIQPVSLNREGKIIGHIVKYKKKFYYLSERRPEHYFIKFRGFGIDKALFKTFIGKKPIEIIGIIIHYKGKKEDRFYFADLDTWFLKSVSYGTAKRTGETVETYGEQYILNKKHMKVIGYGINDHEVNKPRPLDKYK